MIKNMIVLAGVLFLSFPALAEENKAEEVASQTLAGLNQQGKAELEKAVRKTDPAVIDQSAFESGAFQESEEAEGEIPAAVFPETPASPVPEGKTSEAAAVAVDPAAVKPSPATSTPPIKTSVMEANWNALFSNKMTPSIKTYTIQPGDSLYVLANKNHTTVDLIKKMSGLKNDTIYAGKELRIYTGTFSILVDKSENVLILFADGKPVRKYHVSTGKKDSTPAGEFKIVNKLVNPTWFTIGAIYPPGSPQNVLGTRWLGFDRPEYGIHGTIEPDKIGQSVSEGCVRMRNAEVEELYSMVPAGTVVTIQE